MYVASEVYSILWLCSSALAVLSHCCCDLSSIVVREQNASNHSRSYVHPAHKIPIGLTSQLKHSEDSCHQKPRIWYDYHQERPGGPATILWAMHKLTSFLQS